MAIFLVWISPCLLMTLISCNTLSHLDQNVIALCYKRDPVDLEHGFLHRRQTRLHTI
jgi:hypothetical protein